MSARCSGVQWCVKSEGIDQESGTRHRLTGGETETVGVMTVEDRLFVDSDIDFSTRSGNKITWSKLWRHFKQWLTGDTMPSKRMQSLGGYDMMWQSDGWRHWGDDERRWRWWRRRGRIWGRRWWWGGDLQAIVDCDSEIDSLPLLVEFPDHMFWPCQVLVIKWAGGSNVLWMGFGESRHPMRNSRSLFLVRLSFTASTKYCGFSLLDVSKGLLLVRIGPDFPGGNRNSIIQWQLTRNGN